MLSRFRWNKNNFAKDERPITHANLCPEARNCMLLGALNFYSLRVNLSKFYIIIFPHYALRDYFSDFLF